MPESMAGSADLTAAHGILNSLSNASKLEKYLRPRELTVQERIAIELLRFVFVPGSGSRYR